MKNGYYLSTYLFINELACLTDIELRHDMNISVWKKDGTKIQLVRYWELERVTGLKQHRKAFYNVEHARRIIEELLGELELSLDDMIQVWGTPELDTCNDYHSIEEHKEFCYHSICHLYSSLLMHTEIFLKDNILAFAVDGIPDNVVDLDIEHKNYYTASVSEKGEIKHMFAAYSPGIHWGYIRDFFNMREGSLMALASACSCKLYNKSLKLILVKNRNQVADVIDDVEILINYVNNLSEKDSGILFNGFDSNFSETENRISMVVKEVQKISELIMEANINNAREKYGIKTEDFFVSLSGGFALNCPVNSYIMKKNRFKGFIAPPCVNDAGISLGMALYYFYKKVGSQIFFEFENAYYGEADNVIKKFIERNQDYIEEIEKYDLDKVVEDITLEPIVWFNAHAEIGPRALGNRSILADPRNFETKATLNKIKQRQWWRPVAPIVLEEKAKYWFENSYPTKYMLHTFQVYNDKKKLVPAISHTDGSARVQTINKKENSVLYQLVKSFDKKTGIPIICNTSLNDKGEPIINTLDEMINFALRKKINIVYANGLRLKLKNHSIFTEKEVASRKIGFENYIKNLDFEAELKRLNPFKIEREMLIVYIQNPKLYDRIDLRRKESIKILERMTQLQRNKFHII